MESPSVESFESVGNTAKYDTKKKLKRNMRRLAEGKKNKRTSNGTSQVLRQIVAAGIVLSICLLVVHLQSPEKTKLLFDNFMKTYKSNYYQIFYGSKHYCSRCLSTNLIERLSKQVLNQDEVLKRLDETLAVGNRITSIAFVGTSGVGKTLLAHTMQQNFPWPDNIHSYAWNTYVRNEADRFSLLQLFFDGLSDCGRNLLIIDNLVASDYQIVNQMQESLRKSVDKNKNVIVIFIFNLNAYEEHKVFEENYNLLQNISKTAVINFKKFDIGDLYECIEHEAELEKLKLDPEDFKEIIDTIDVSTSGCKNVFAKVLMYGKKK